MNLSWLNPVNWIKAGVAAKADAEIDKRLSAENLANDARQGINYLVALSKSKVDDQKLRMISQDLIFAGEAMKELGEAINPDGEEGRKLSESELSALNARVQVLFGDVFHEWDLAAIREKAKAIVRKALGV